MIVFNCTKAAADFFTVTRSGEKLTCLTPAPDKAIAESIEKDLSHVSFSYDDDLKRTEGFQWQWVVHCVSVKRKKYFLVMDFDTRYCLAFAAGRKGDEIHFLSQFEEQLKANFRYFVDVNQSSQELASELIDTYDRYTQSVAFHQRNDRSVQAHLNEVAWHFEGLCSEVGMLSDRMDFLRFSVTAGNIPRKKKGDQSYFYAKDNFYQFWFDHFHSGSETANNNVIEMLAPSNNSGSGSS